VRFVRKVAREAATIYENMSRELHVNDITAAIVGVENKAVFGTLGMSLRGVCSTGMVRQEGRNVGVVNEQEKKVEMRKRGACCEEEGSFCRQQKRAVH